jgi:hypothetical protein
VRGGAIERRPKPIGLNRRSRRSRKLIRKTAFSLSLRFVAFCSCFRMKNRKAKTSQRPTSEETLIADVESQIRARARRAISQIRRRSVRRGVPSAAEIKQEIAALRKLIEPAPTKTLLATLRTLRPIRERFVRIDDLPSEPLR